MSLSFLREKMLTSSSNQYLRPEYLTPLPTTLDAKKSPLALLAQTCSQIGADPPSSKSLLPSLSNSSSSSSSSSTSSQSHTTNNTSNSHHHSSSTSSTDSVNGNRNSSTTPNSSERLPKKSHNRKQSNSASPNSLKSPSSASPNSSSSLNNNLTSTTLSSSSSRENVTIAEDDSKTLQRSKTPGSKSGTPVSGTTSPNNLQSAPGPGKNSPSAQSLSMSLSLSSSSSSSNSSNYLPETTSTSVSRPSTFDTSSLSTSSISTAAVSSGSNINISSSKLNLTGPDLSPLGSLKHSASVTSSLVPFPGLYPGLPPPSLTSAAGQGIPPYLHSYARLKAAAAAGGNDPLAALTSPLSSLGGGGPSGGCRDPFCTGCQLGSGHLSGGSSGGGKCPAGCSQCDHHKSSLGALGSGAFNGFPFFPGFPSLPPSLAGLSAAYGSPSSHGSSGLQSSQSLAVTPYVCNWVGGPDNYCGKRFSSSDELFQHLRSHTSLSSANSQAASDCAALMERYSQAAASTHPLLSSAAAAAHINRTYPTPPLSPLSSARFHPYSKPGSGMSLSSLGLQTNPSAAASLAATFPPPGFSALAHPLSPYYPYSFYGQRLGTSGSLHP